MAAFPNRAMQQSPTKLDNESDLSDVPRGLDGGDASEPSPEYEELAEHTEAALLAAMGNDRRIVTGFRLKYILQLIQEKFAQLAGIDTADKNAFRLEILATADPARTETQTDVCFLTGTALIEVLEEAKWNSKEYHGVSGFHSKQTVEQMIAGIKQFVSAIDLALEDERKKGEDRASEIAAVEIAAVEEMQAAPLLRALYMPSKNKKNTVPDLEGDSSVEVTGTKTAGIDKGRGVFASAEALRKRAQIVSESAKADTQKQQAPRGKVDSSAPQKRAAQ